MPSKVKINTNAFVFWSLWEELKAYEINIYMYNCEKVKLTLFLMNFYCGMFDYGMWQVGSINVKGMWVLNLSMNLTIIFLLFWAN